MTKIVKPKLKVDTRPPFADKSRDLALTSSEKIRNKIAKQDNVKIKIPPTDRTQGYTVVCTREFAKSKYPKYPHHELNQNTYS
jgi:hypothetical protein